MGKGSSSGRFYKFIDESYFGYQFWIWGTILSILGIGMIVAGNVVYATLPPAREAEIIASAKLASGDTESLTYTSWSSIVQTVSFTFKDIDTSGAAPTCNNVGPYVYAFTTSKASLVFSADGTKVTYSIKSNKAFSTTASVPMQSVRLVDPQYAAIIEEAGGETEFFWDLFKNKGNYSAALPSFIENDMPALLGSRAYSRSFPGAYKAARRNVLDGAVFGTQIKDAVDMYPHFYANTMLNGYCPTFFDAALCGFTDMFNWYTSLDDCRDGRDGGMHPSKNVFYGAMANAWNDVDSNICSDYYRERSLDPAAGFTADQAEQAIEADLSYWNNELGTGVCQITRAGVTIGGQTLTVDQVNSFCDDFLPKWYKETVPAGLTMAELGTVKLCVGEIEELGNDFKVTQPAFQIFSLPSSVKGQMPVVNIDRDTYDVQECGKIVAALADVDDFVVPIIEDGDVTRDHQLSAADLALATAFVKEHSSTTQKWLFLHYIVSSQNAATNPINTCTDCVFKSLNNYGIDVSAFNATNTFKAFIHFFFPEMMPTDHPQKIIVDRHASTYMDPKPAILTGGVFGTWQTSTPGSLSYLRDTIPSTVFPAFGLDATTGPTMKTYITKVAEDILNAEYQRATLVDVAYEHFATGNALYGTDCATVTKACSIVHEFYAFDGDYYMEYGVARALGPFTYTNSFGGPDATPSDPTLQYGDVSVMISILFSSEYDDIVHVAALKYFHYFAPTFVRADFFKATDGILPLRAASIWIDSLPDNSSLVAEFGGPNVAFHVTSPFPPATPREYTIYTGTDEGSKSFKFHSVEGLAQAVSADGNVAIDGLYNTDQFPPGAVKEGDKIKIFDPVLERALTATVGAVEDVESLSGNAITMEKLPWALRTVIDEVSGAALVPCGAISGAPSGLVCGDATDEDVARKVVVSLNSGKVLHEQHCYQSIAAIGNVTFPITEPKLAKDTFYSQAQVTYRRTISTAEADEFAAQFNETEELASNIRAALSAVGAVFLLAGLVFIVFAIMRRVRKQKQKAETELVEDPFKENQRTGFTR